MSNARTNDDDGGGAWKRYETALLDWARGGRVGKKPEAVDFYSALRTGADAAPRVSVHETAPANDHQPELEPREVADKRKPVVVDGRATWAERGPVVLGGRETVVLTGRAGGAL